jgi:putative DNA primase/helicase
VTAQNIEDFALAAAERIGPVFPVVRNGKAPAVKNWQRRATRSSEAVLRFRLRDQNYGIYTGDGLLVVDIDCKGSADGEASLERLKSHGLELPDTFEVTTPSGGRHLYFAVDRSVASSASKLAPGIDIRSAGALIVGPGSVIDGKRYAITRDITIARAPDELIRQCGSPLAAEAKEPARSGKDHVAVIPSDPVKAQKRAIAYLTENAPHAFEGRGGDSTTYKVCCRLKDLGVEKEAALHLLLEYWNDDCEPPWDPNDLDDKVRNAYAYGSKPQGDAVPEGHFEKVPVDETLSAVYEMPSPAFSDDAMARSVAGDNPNVRYVAAWNTWYHFDGCRWKQDDTLKVFDLARQCLRRHARSCNEPGQKKRLASAGTVAAVVSLWRSDRQVAATVDQWDADPWLLCTPAAVVDLRTGEERAHRPTDYFTKSTAASRGSDCPLWHQFLERITDGDGELQHFLKKVAGYALTGNTSEHALFFLFGTGGNGKGVFLNTLTGLLKDYAAVANVDTFTASHSDRHPTDLAMLRGARLVVAQETEDGKHWAESKIKSLTGGDPITARFMRQDFFTYTPQFKLLVAGNHKPSLRNVDEATRRRMNLLPFTVTIPENERDPRLQEKLRDEWPGILSWAIDGCLLWQKEGLCAPKSVRSATSEYLIEEDALATWIDECCAVQPDVWTSGAELFQQWKHWAERSGESAGARRRFTQNLEARGYRRGRKPGSGDHGFVGITPQKALSMTSNQGACSDAAQFFAQ